MARMKSMAESPQAKAIGQKLAQKARDPATRAKLSGGVRKLRRRKS
jgi:hypothetical protein